MVPGDWYRLQYHGNINVAFPVNIDIFFLELGHINAEARVNIEQKKDRKKEICFPVTQLLPNVKRTDLVVSTQRMNVHSIKTVLFIEN